ncbi:hypothetical protein FNV43_RR19704 [Rhamnella rubrinervis]|uniref:Uncharacterized protein n=1 Tax=Rhamnella rubrinervis TaxID=2594499 RepID=A0A8K0DYC3_9ROSA|nr:hypothetical protein FNV43_RR19704 [Rhamnella rubrinervis]
MQLAQTSRFLYEAIVKVDVACKKKTAAYESSAETNKTLQATNKTLEANNLHLKQAAADANSRAEQAELKLLQAEKKWSETDQKLAEKNKELEAQRTSHAVESGTSYKLSLARHEEKDRLPQGSRGRLPPSPKRNDSKTSQNRTTSHWRTAPTEKSSPHEKDSFDEAMEEARTNTAGPSTNAKEVASASQPSQEEV